ncbi:MAG: zinc ribbon domain-containing protein [Nitrospinae bacterium]|nr:zinc ribbon domain-containing protein [Nitrospinota bacterium]
MPIYEYECQKCGVTFEVMQPVSAQPLKNHEGAKCNGSVRRLVSASGFILKGSGWYATDYPSESRKKGWEQESGTAPTSAKAEPSEASCGDTACPPAPKETASAKPEHPPAKSKPAARNPYSSKKTKTVKKASKVSR